MLGLEPEHTQRQEEEPETEIGCIGVGPLSAMAAMSAVARPCKIVSQDLYDTFIILPMWENH